MGASKQELQILTDNPSDKASVCDMEISRERSKIVINSESRFRRNTHEWSSTGRNESI